MKTVLKFEVLGSYWSFVQIDIVVFQSRFFAIGLIFAKLFTRLYECLSENQQKLKVMNPTKIKCQPLITRVIEQNQ